MSSSEDPTGLVALNNVIQYVNGFLCKPFSDTSYMVDWEFHHGKHVVPRPNHGLAHTLRCTSYVPVVLAYLNQTEHAQQFQFDENTIKRIQIALLFAVVGRENDIGFKDDSNTYFKFRQQSADIFEKYCQQYEKVLFSPAELAFYKQAVYNFGDPFETHPIKTLMRLCHKLDLLRCYSNSQMQNKIYPEFDSLFGNKMKNELFHYAQQCIDATGDRLMSGTNYHYYIPEKFIESSTNVTACIANITSVQLPELACYNGHTKSSALNTSRLPLFSFWCQFYLAARTRNLKGCSDKVVSLPRETVGLITERLCRSRPS